MRQVFANLMNAKQPGDPISASHLWFHLGNTAATGVFIKVGIAVAAMPNPNIEGLAIFMFAYLGLITGNKLAMKVIQYKMSPRQMVEPTSLSVTATVETGSTQQAQPHNSGEHSHER